MNKLSDERLEQMLTAYCKAESEQSFVYEPEHKPGIIIPFAKISRVAAAAAVLLVTALTVTIFLLNGNNTVTPIAVAPSTQLSSSPAQTVEPSGGISTDPSYTDPGVALPSEPVSPAPTDPHGNILPTDLSSSPSAPTNETSVPSTAPKPTDSIGEKPTESDTPKPTAPEIKPTEPSQKPTVPIDPPWISPTDPPESPTEPPYVSSTEAGEPMLPPSETVVYATFRSSLLSGSEVYCKVFNSSGKRLGSSDLYDDSHWADILVRGAEYSTAAYAAPGWLFDSPGNYYFVFYDSSGKMLAQVQEYID